MTSDPTILVQPSPLHARTAPLCLTNAWVQDTRLTLVDVYRSLEEEYWALRDGAGLYDASAYFAYRLSGADAMAGADHLLASQVAHLAVGDVKQVLWCDDFGHVIGLGRVLRLGVDELELQTRARALSWIEDSVGGLACRVEETTGLSASVGLVGPLASAVLERAGFKPAEPLVHGQSARWESRGLSVRVARLGACGSPAYRLWIMADDALLLWDRLMNAGTPLGLKPVGAAARELARIEAGLPRLGIDFISALEVVPWTVAATPEALGLSALIEDAKGMFVGRNALRRAQEPVQRLVRLVVDGEGPLVPAFVLSGAKPVGFVTSAAWSPLVGAGFALAWVASEALASGASLRLLRPPRLGQPAEPNGIVCRLRDETSVAQALAGPGPDAAAPANRLA